ncbi:MAG: S8 family serine peptidase [Myxococcota bacterium]
MAAATNVTFNAPSHHVPGRAILKLRGIHPEQLAVSASAVAALRELEKRVGVRITPVRPLQLGWGLYQVADALAPQKIVDEAETMRLITVLRADATVEGAVEDRWYRPLATPNDPGFSQMWHLNAIGATASWDITQGTASQRVGVVDTGTVRAHEDLSAKDLAGYDFIDDPSQAADGNGRDSNWDDPGDGADCGGGYQDSSFHGTHVAGTILASANNGKGIAGVNWNAKLVTARALGRCGGALSDIGDASYWLAGGNVSGVPAIGANKVSVMNLSLGGPGACSQYEQQVVNYVNSQGVIFVAAAGNDGGEVGSPANCTGVITVAAHGPGVNRTLASYSSFGNSVEIVAPGGNMVSSQSQGVLSAVGPDADTYNWYEGTSMAAPHVTGAISLMQSLNPALTRTEIVTLLQTHGVDCTNCQGKKAMKLDAVLDAMGGTVVDPGTPDAGNPDPGPTDDTYEENDSFDTSKPVTCGADLQLFMAPNEMDWFNVSVPAGQTLKVVLDSADDAQDLDLYVSNASGEAGVLDRSETTTGNEQIEMTAPGGALAIGVNSYQGATSNYRLQVSCQPPANPDPDPAPDAGNTNPDPDPDPGTPDAGNTNPDPNPSDDNQEPNDNFGSARPVDCGTTLTLVAAQGDEDWFSLTAPAGTRITATVSTDSGADLGLRLTDDPANVSTLATAQTLNGSGTATAVTAGGTVGVGLRASQNATYGYSLQIGCQTEGTDPGPGPGTPGNDDTAEPNNDLPSATRIACGAAGAFISRDADVFVLTVDAGDTLKVEFSGEETLAVELLDGSGNSLGVASTADGHTFARKSNVSGGDLYFRVTTDAYSGNSYDLQVTCSAPSDDSSASAGCTQSSPCPLPLLGLAALLVRRRQRR